MKRKAIAVLLFGAAILLALQVFAMAASYKCFSDVSDDALYAGEINALREAGIFTGDENGKFNPNKTMTRAEVAAIMVRLFVGEAEPVYGAGSFADVASTHWAFGYIETAVLHGMISGYGNGNFGPGDSLTYAQAVTLLVRALGYDEMAQELGGWPDGYINIGSGLGITDDNVNFEGNPVPRSTVAKLIYNAWHEERDVQSEYDNWDWEDDGIAGTEYAPLEDYEME